MTDSDFAVNALRNAVQLAPENAALAEHLCTTLVQLGRLEDAEAEYLAALQRHPQNVALKLGLAETYWRQQKNSHALAITESMVAGDDPPAKAFIVHARLMYRAGDVPAAVHFYKEGISIDPAVADDELASLLGIQDESTWTELDGDEDEDTQEVVDGRIRMSASEHPGDGAEDAVEKPKTSFDDVGGMEKVKEEVRVKIIYPLQYADMYAAYGKAIGGGILMYGPPGCGKTHLARATAGEVSAKFMSIGINDILDMWMGNSERNLHELFELARRNKPCVLFFDEVDALGASRSDMRQSAGRHLINQFLSELDGANSANDGILILGATNAPWHVDNAFRRPGRFDRVIFVPPPDEAARQDILRIHLEGKPQDRVDLKKAAAKTRDFSGADIQSLVDRAVEEKLTAAVKSGRPTPITTRDLLSAAKRMKPSTSEWFASARNHALYSNQGGVYDDILDYLKLKK